MTIVDDKFLNSPVDIRSRQTSVLCVMVLVTRQYEEVEVSSDYLMNIIAFQSYKRKEGMRLYIK